MSLALTLATASSVGCTVLVEGELVDKPAEGSGGQGGGDASTDVQSSAAQSGSGNGSGTGGPMCKPGTADCNGSLLDGCEAKLRTDPKNCGACKKACELGAQCEDGECE